MRLVYEWNKIMKNYHVSLFVYMYTQEKVFGGNPMLNAYGIQIKGSFTKPGNCDILGN